ncbi:hypothetical protein TNCV_2381341 [Trichonephila clavipes]|nr:hypothetical protein TNCV_2381341 [Trichonephila clavipes]
MVWKFGEGVPAQVRHLNVTQIYEVRHQQPLRCFRLQSKLKSPLKRRDCYGICPLYRTHRVRDPSANPLHNTLQRNKSQGVSPYNN